jgi:hypothetical protein
MKEAVLSVAENQFSEIPEELWAQHVQQTAKEIPKVLDFMTKDHHLMRYFVVRELPRIGKPITIELDNEMNCDVHQQNCTPHLISPRVDWDSFAAPNIIPDF